MADMILFLGGTRSGKSTRAEAEAMKAEGDTEVLKKIMKNLNQFNLNAEKSFNLIEP